MSNERTLRQFSKLGDTNNSQYLLYFAYSTIDSTGKIEKWKENGIELHTSKISFLSLISL